MGVPGNGNPSRSPEPPKGRSPMVIYFLTPDAAASSINRISDGVGAALTAKLLKSASALFNCASLVTLARPTCVFVTECGLLVLEICESI